MKILYVTTISETMIFFTEHINMLIDNNHSVDMACKLESPINEQLIKRGCRVFDIKFSRSPFKRSNLQAYKDIKKLINREKYDIVHVHTPVAAAVTRFACRNNDDIKIMYTAHGFHFYEGAPLKCWLLYYPVERYLSKYTDVLITINHDDYARAKRSFKAGRIEYVPGVGLDTISFSNTRIKKDQKRIELGIPVKAFVLLSVGELNSNKNHEIVIKALAKLNADNIFYLICGQGELREYLLELSAKYGLSKQIMLLGFRNDIPALYRTADVFIHPSFREGLSVALMESMAAGLAVLCSNIRGNRDLIKDGKGGYLVAANDSDKFAEAINILLASKDLRESFGEYNRVRILDFDTNRVITKMKAIYNY